MPRTCARRQRPAIVGTGRVSVKELLRRSTYNNRISGLEKRINEDRHFAALFQRIHDLCLVWTSQIWSCMAALPTLFVLEGGYAVGEIGVNVVNVLTGFEEAFREFSR